MATNRTHQYDVVMKIMRGIKNTLNDIEDTHLLRKLNREIHKGLSDAYVKGYEEGYIDDWEVLTDDEISDWDATLLDGLEHEEPWLDEYLQPMENKDEKR